MTASFSVRTSPGFDRLLRRLNKRHPELVDIYDEAITVLATDPYNRSRTHHIKKLEAQRLGSGQLPLAAWSLAVSL